MVYGFGVPLARLAFLLRLGEERVRRNLYLGEVFGPDGSCWEDWVTFRGKRRLIVRGSTEHAGNRVCPECGRNCYFGMPPNYLYPEPRSDVEIFESSGFGLVIPDSVATEAGIGRKVRRVQGVEEVEWPGAEIGGKRKRVLVELLRVLPEPKDGLPPLSF